MKQRIATYIKNGFAGINHPVMIASIVVSLGLWYLNRLGKDYTTTVTLPVSIVAAADGPVGVLDNEHAVECRIKGTGYELLRYRLRPKHYRQEVELDRLELRPVAGTNRSEVVPLSLRDAIAGKLAEMEESVELQAILTPRIEISTAPFRTKKLPVHSGMEFDYRRPYMAVGPVRFSPRQVEVRSLDFVLDTLTAVRTQYRRFTHVNGSVSGSIDLEPIRDVVFPVREVAFELAVEEYAEVDVQLPVTLLNVPKGRMPVVIPGEVEVRLRVAGGRAADKVEAVVDYNDPEAQGGKYKVVVSTPDGIEVGRVEPAEVELIFGEP
jgi:hypothetical protein